MRFRSVSAVAALRMSLRSASLTDRVRVPLGVWAARAAVQPSAAAMTICGAVIDYAASIAGGGSKITGALIDPGDTP